jgi:deoxyribose-phosphate aldolase
MDIAGMIDHTLLKAEATPKDIDALCREARDYNFAAVCVNPSFVERSVGMLKGSGVRIATVVGFPLGATTLVEKAREAGDAVRHGAREIDMVMPVGLFLGGEHKAVARDIREVILAVGATPVKVILETCYLSPKQITEACLIACNEGAAFVKTSTGFGTRGATVEDVQVMKQSVGDRCGIKASGGIRNYRDTMAMIEAGATRIGTSSGVAIVEEARKA